MDACMYVLLSLLTSCEPLNAQGQADRFDSFLCDCGAAARLRAGSVTT